MVLPLRVGLLGLLGAVAEAMPDNADEQVAVLHFVSAEGVHIPVARSEILHADAMPVVQFVQRGIGCFAVSA